MVIISICSLFSDLGEETARQLQTSHLSLSTNKGQVCFEAEECINSILNQMLLKSPLYTFKFTISCVLVQSDATTFLLLVHERLYLCSQRSLWFDQ